jgi:hypothetical protein
MGRISLPLVSMVSPAEWYIFPPALCPIWSDGSLPLYLGYWKHWFTSRSGTFVSMYVESGRKVYEIARTPGQLFCHAIMSAIIIHDRVTPAIERFASAVGIGNVSEINDVSLQTGDNPLGYTAISQFQSDTPLASVTDVSRYTGNFPTGDFSGSLRWWDDACSFEVPDQTLEAWPTNTVKPLWFADGDRIEIFENFLIASDFHSAWLILNSPGWSIPDAKAAISRLASSANDNDFSLLATAWTSVAEEGSGGY